jgi:hypothetical protein
MTTKVSVVTVMSRLRDENGDNLHVERRARVQHIGALKHLLKKHHDQDLQLNIHINMYVNDNWIVSMVYDGDYRAGVAQLTIADRSDHFERALHLESGMRVQQILSLADFLSAAQRAVIALRQHEKAMRNKLLSYSVVVYNVYTHHTETLHTSEQVQYVLQRIARGRMYVPTGHMQYGDTTIAVYPSYIDEHQYKVFNQNGFVGEMQPNEALKPFLSYVLEYETHKNNRHH